VKFLSTKTEVPSQQPYQHEGMAMMQVKTVDNLKAAVSISLTLFEVPSVSSHPAQEQGNFENCIWQTQPWSNMALETLKPL
jgi:hypothetical protein